MSDIYVKSDADIVGRIAAKLKVLRLRQNISRQDLSAASGVSVSSIARMEDGEIKSFDSLIRVLRTLGKLDVLAPLVDEEEMSPNEYFKMMHSSQPRQRRRASRSKIEKQRENPEW